MAGEEGRGERKGGRRRGNGRRKDDGREGGTEGGEGSILFVFLSFCISLQLSLMTI